MKEVGHLLQVDAHFKKPVNLSSIKILFLNFYKVYIKKLSLPIINIIYLVDA